jgi:hypothetical protein
MSFDLPVWAIVTLATVFIAAIWSYDIWRDDIKRWWTARKDLRRHNKQEKAHKQLIKECFAESRMWEERKLERDRRHAEREARRREEEAA